VRHSLLLRNRALVFSAAAVFISLRAAGAFSPGSFSADGRYFVFSTVNNLVPIDTGSTEDVYRYDGQTGEFVLVSVNQSSSAGGDYPSHSPVISAEGTVVAFESAASNLSAMDQNGAVDVFVRHLPTGITTLVSLNQVGTNSGNQPSSHARLSADGQYVAFVTEATDLATVPDVNGANRDVFVHDRRTGLNTLVSVNQAGSATANDASDFSPVTAQDAFSPDGRFVVFVSRASDLVANDGNPHRDVFARDLVAGTTTLVSVNQSGTSGGNADSFDPTVNSNGTVVAFVSLAGDLVANDSNGQNDLFARDLTTGATELVSVAQNSVGSANGNSGGPRLSADGRIVAFVSTADNLTANSGLTNVNVFVRDRLTGVTELVSANLAGAGSAAGGSSCFALLPNEEGLVAESDCVTLSANGQVVAFVSEAADLTTNNLNGLPNLFVRNLTTRLTELASVNRSGEGSSNLFSCGDCFQSELSPDGTVLAFRSTATELAAHDITGFGPNFLFAVNDPPAPAFIESAGLVVLEAEHFHATTIASGHAWVPSTEVTGFAGESAMAATPARGTIFSTNVAYNSPVLRYRVELAAAGSYNLWVRGWAANESDDSVHLGVDGQVLEALPFNQTDVWVWRAKQVIVPTPGRHELNIWMREDGAYVDRLLLSADPNFIPTGEGPVESPISNLAPAVQLVAPGPGTSVRVGSLLTIAAEAADGDGSIAQVAIHVNGNLLKLDATPPYSCVWKPAPGSYAVTAVATDDRGKSTTSPPVAVTVIGTFEESGGQLIMEAEHCETATTASGHAWGRHTGVAGFAGECALRAEPVVGTAITENVAAASPALSYPAQFAMGGTYNFWVRGWGSDGAQDSVHIGVDGQVLRVLPFSQTGVWMWRAGQVFIPGPGMHNLNVWMREDGAAIDRLVLTTNLSFAPTGAGPLESSRFGGPPPPNTPPTVQLTASTPGDSVPMGTALTLTATAGDSDGPVTQVEFYANQNLLVVDAVEPYGCEWTPPSGQYSLIAVARDDRGLTALSAPVNITVLDAFVESGGLVVMEAEHFDTFTATDHAWAANTDHAGFAGESAMQALPNTGSSITANITVSSPALNYRVVLTTAGVFNFWIRGWAESEADDSLHIGVDGQVLQTLNYSQTGEWMWRSRQVHIPSPGAHEINVWMREDGVFLDRILLATNLSFTPTGNGPVESDR